MLLAACTRGRETVPVSRIATQRAIGGFRSRGAALRGPKRSCRRARREYRVGRRLCGGGSRRNIQERCLAARGVDAYLAVVVRGVRRAFSRALSADRSIDPNKLVSGQIQDVRSQKVDHNHPDGMVPELAYVPRCVLCLLICSVCSSARLLGLLRSASVCSACLLCLLTGDTVQIAMQ